MGGYARPLTPALVLSVGAVALAFVIATVILRAVVPDNEIAGGLASITIGAGPYIHRALSGLFVPTRPAVHVPPPSHFSLPAGVMALIAMSVLSLAMLLGDIGSFALGPIASVSPMIDTILRIAPPTTAFVLGSWIGARADRHAALAIGAAVLGAFLVARALTAPAIGLITGSPGQVLIDTSPCAETAFVPAAGLGLRVAALPSGPPVLPSGGPPVIPPPASATTPGDPPAVTPAPDPPVDGPPPFNPNDIYGDCVLERLLDNTLLLVGAFGLIGAWRGGATREARYLTVLLQAVSVPARQTIIDLAYEEATRSTSAAIQPPDQAGLSDPADKSRLG